MIISLLGNSAAVTFGALGTPILVGIAQGTVLPEGVELREIAIWAVMLHVITLLITLSAMVWQAAAGQGVFRRVLRVALPAATAFGMAYLFSVLLMPLEIVSIVASLCGLGLFFVLYFLVNNPKRIRLSWSQLFCASYPILISILSLLIVKFLIIPLVGRNIFTSPGVAILLAGLLVIMFAKTRVNWSKMLSKLAKPVLVLTCVVSMAQLIINSGEGANSLTSIAGILADNLLWLGGFYPIVSGFLGLAGTFISGSATVSNLLFADLQLAASQVTGVSAVTTLAMQTFSSAAANPVALTNIAAGQATVNIQSGQEKQILEVNFKIVIIALLVAGTVIVILF